MIREALDEWKRHISLSTISSMIGGLDVDSSAADGWTRPLHRDHNTSCLVDPNKGVFHCYSCGRGGDVIRFAEIYHDLKFPQAPGLLRQCLCTTWQVIMHTSAFDPVASRKIRLWEIVVQTPLAAYRRISRQPGDNLYLEGGRGC